MLGASRRVYHALEFIIDFFRSTPASAVFPLFLVIFGVDDLAQGVTGVSQAQANVPMLRFNLTTNIALAPEVLE